MASDQDFDLKNNDVGALDRIDKGWIEYVVQKHMVILEKYDEEHLSCACTAICSDLIRFLDVPDNGFENEILIKLILKISRLGIHSMNVYEVKGFRALQIPIYHNFAGELYYDHAYACLLLNRPFACLRYLDTAEKLFKSYRSQIVKLNAQDLIAEDNSLIFYEWCRLKEAEAWSSYIEAVPKDYRGFFINVVQSYLRDSVVEFYKLGSFENMKYAYSKLLDSACKYPDIGFIDSQKVIELNTSVIPDGYEGWCFNRVLYLNIYNEIPNYNPDWCFDESLFGLEGDESEIYDDIVHTFDHCRHLLYEFTSIEDDIRFRKGRDEDVEKLVDCYMRLYSLFDKVSKIINSKFNLGVPLDKVSFKTVSVKLKNHANRYLRAIVQVGDDLYPKKEEIFLGSLSPLASTVGYVCKPSDIRNCMTHSGFRVVGDYKGTEYSKNLVNVTVMDLEITTTDLMYAIREIILLIKLAEAEIKIE